MLIGGGGHAVVVAEAALLSGWRLGGFVDDREDAQLADGSPAAWWLGPLSSWEAAGERACILAVGGLALRRSLLTSLKLLPAQTGSVVHPAAVLSPSARVGAGVYVGPAAVVHSRAAVGDHAIINSAAIIEHDCRIGENSHIAPGAVLGGGVSVGHDTLVGLGARVLPGVRIGRECTVAAGAVVLSDVADGVTVAGVPALPTAPQGGKSPRQG